VGFALRGATALTELLKRANDGDFSPFVFNRLQLLQECLRLHLVASADRAPARQELDTQIFATGCSEFMAREYPTILASHWE
jgi:hypothetical protein